MEEDNEVEELANKDMKDIDITEDDDQFHNEDDEEKTLLDMLQDRIGQQMSVGELNTVLQSLFSQYNKLFLTATDLYNMDLDETQELVVDDDEEMYVIKYDIADMDNGIIEITDVDLEY